MMTRRDGLTLIEVMAVVALLGIIAAATAWSMADDVRRGSEQTVISQIQYADRMARIAADRLGGRCVLRFDIDGQRVRRVMADEAGDEAAAHTLRLPGAMRMDRVMFAGRVEESGAAEIAYATGRRSESYAVRLTLGRDRKPVWLVFAGLTGQMVRMNDEMEVDKLFENLAAGWDDAD